MTLQHPLMTLKVIFLVVMILVTGFSAGLSENPDIPSPAASIRKDPQDLIFEKITQSIMDYKQKNGNQSLTVPQLQSILINEYNFSPTDPSVTNNLVILRALKSAKTQTATRAKKISPNASGLPNLEKVSPYLHEESDAGATSTTVPKYIEIPRGEFAEMAKKALEDYATKNDGPSTFTPEEAHEILKKIGFDPNDSRMLTNNLRKLLGRTSLLAINPPQTSSSSSSTSQAHPSMSPQNQAADAGAASTTVPKYIEIPRGEFTEMVGTTLKNYAKNGGPSSFTPKEAHEILKKIGFDPKDQRMNYRNGTALRSALKTRGLLAIDRPYTRSSSSSTSQAHPSMSPQNQAADAGAASTTVPKYIEISQGNFTEMVGTTLKNYAKNGGPSSFTPKEAHEILKKIGFDPEDQRMNYRNCATLRGALERRGLLAIDRPHTSSSSSSTSQPHPSRIPQTEEANAGTGAASASPAQYPDTPENFYDTRDQILSLGKKKSSPLIPNIPLNQSDSPACKKAATLAQEEHFLANLDLGSIDNFLDKLIPGSPTHFPPPDLSGLENPLFPQLLDLPGIPNFADGSVSEIPLETTQIRPPDTSSSSSSTSQAHPSRIPQTEEANAGTSAASASPAQYPDTPENFYDTRDQILSLGKKKSSPLIRNIPLNQSDSPACKKASTLAQEEHFLANLDLDLDLDLIGNLLDEPIPGTLTHFPPPDLSGLENPLFPQLLYLPGIPLTAPSSSSVPSLELSTDVKKYFLVNLWDNEKDEPLVKLTLEKALKRLVNNGKINSTQAENTEFKKTLEDFMRDNQFL